MAELKQNGKFTRRHHQQSNGCWEHNRWAGRWSIKPPTKEDIKNNLKYKQTDNKRNSKKIQTVA